MSFMNPVDLVDEDAADLQFPKDGSCGDIEENFISLAPSSVTKFITKYYHPDSLAQCSADVSDYVEKCEICKSWLQEPYIKCPDCLILLCLQCFSRGKETARHRNTHPYIIVHDNIQVFPWSSWTAREEKLFLSSLQSCGYGNWEAVSKAMKTRSPEECQKHYHDCYFDGIFEKLLGLSNDAYFPERMPYLYNMRSVEPPRHDNIDSITFKIMAGYRCARGDFETPYDNTAESLISNLEDISKWPSEYRHVGEELHCALVRAYNHRLAERHRRYNIMRDNGLIMPNRTLSWISKYSEALGSESNSGRFLAFMQITNGVKFDMLVEGMKHFSDLQKYLFRLYELRSNGVRTLRGGSLYFKLKRKRLQEQRERKSDRLCQQYDWRKLLPDMNVSTNGPYIIPNTAILNPRKKAAPIDIIGLPGYAKLDESERNLCSVARLVPTAFIEYKNLLIGENSKLGYLRLADARRLIKIDVNKTRQIYDFLLENGHITKPI